MKDKLRNLGFPQSVAREFIDDIFGKQTGSHLEAGLVDSESEAVFRNVLLKLQYRWTNLERSCILSDSEPQFHAWFCKFKAEDIIIVQVCQCDPKLVQILIAYSLPIVENQLTT